VAGFSEHCNEPSGSIKAISLLAERLPASQEGLYSMELEANNIYIETTI
jgi:hypothetical protein